MAQQAPATSSEGAGFVKKIAKMGEVVWWSAALALAAVTLTLGNKWIMHDFHFPLTLLLVQNTTAAIVILITAMAMKLAGKSRMEPFTASQIIIVLGSAAVSTLQLAASLIALPHISIATLTVFGNGRALIQSFIEVCLLGERFGWKEYVALGIIAGTSIFYTSGDKTSSLAGIAWLATNCLAYVGLGIYKRFFYNRIKQTDFGIGLLENIFTIPFIIIICVAGGEIPLPESISFFSAVRVPGMAVHTVAPWVAVKECGFVTLCLIAFTAIFAASMNIIYTNLFRLVAATSVTVLANMNKAVSVGIATFLFHKAMPPQQFFALGIVMLAGVWFSMERKKTRSAQKDAAAAAAIRAAADQEAGELDESNSVELRPLHDTDSESSHADDEV